MKCSPSVMLASRLLLELKSVSLVAMFLPQYANVPQLKISCEFTHSLERNMTT